jgi:hypothetical protein
MQLGYAKYAGDDDERAMEILEAKRAAKAYIRNLVDRLAFYNEWEEVLRAKRNLTQQE